MLLYHGTSEKRAKTILKEGFKPRGRKKGNWEHTVEGNPDVIYLTDSAFALHFSGAATTKKADGRQAIIEIDTDYLLPGGLVADEDAAAQKFAVPSLENHPNALKAKSEHFRTMLIELAVHHSFGHRESLDFLGTCAHLGMIPRAAIKRAIFINRKASFALLMNGVDPTISHINRLILGERYKKMIKIMFGDIEPQLWTNPTMDERMEALKSQAIVFDPRTWEEIKNGIEVINVR